MSRHTSSWLLVPVAINVFSSLIVFFLSGRLGLASIQENGIRLWWRYEREIESLRAPSSCRGSRISLCVFAVAVSEFALLLLEEFSGVLFPEQKKSKNPVTVYIVGMFAENREKRREDNLSSQKSSECLWADLGSAGSCPSLLCYRMKV